MEQNNISFIPKKPMTSGNRADSRPISLFLFLSIFLFIVSVASYGGLYLYKNELSRVLEEKSSLLSVEKDKADPLSIIDKAIALENKTAGVNGVLKSHIASSRAFDFLEEVTLKSISLNNFSFDKFSGVVSTDKTANMGYVVTVDGIASSYSSLAAQADFLNNKVSEKNSIESFSISDIGLDDASNVTFKATLNFPTRFFLYESTLTPADTFTVEEELPKDNSLDADFINNLEKSEGFVEEDNIKNQIQDSIE